MLKELWVALPGYTSLGCAEIRTGDKRVGMYDAALCTRGMQPTLRLAFKRDILQNSKQHARENT